jgi:arylsulfatase A-like enzyme
VGYDNVRNGVPVGTLCNVPGSAQQRLDDGAFSTTTIDNSIGCRDAFLGWWNSTPSPRFAVVSFGAAHAPFKRPPSTILPPGTPFPTTNRGEYETEVQGVDFVIGEMLPSIPSTAYVIFLGDNGTPGNVPGESPTVTDATRADQNPDRVKLSCFEDGVRVPLIVRGPVCTPGLVSQALVHVADILPTVVRMAGPPCPGSTVPTSVQGMSFFGCLQGQASKHASVFVWNNPPSLDMAQIGPRWKLLTRTDGTEELYDLETDPHELTPLVPTGVNADELRARRTAVLAGGP